MTQQTICVVCEGASSLASVIPRGNNYIVQLSTETHICLHQPVLPRPADCYNNVSHLPLCFPLQIYAHTSERYLGLLVKLSALTMGKVIRPITYSAGFFSYRMTYERPCRLSRSEFLNFCLSKRYNYSKTNIERANVYVPPFL